MPEKLKLDKDLEDFIPNYIENRYRDIKLIESLLEENKYKDIARIAHNIKGNAASFCLDPLGLIGIDLEQAAIKEDISLVLENKAKILAYLDNLDISYN